jgi:hypothetical protein
MNPAETKHLSAPGVSGKLVIIGIVTIAFWAAAMSWWFRYNATNRAAKFWGSEVAALIRDAPQVTLRMMPTNSGAAQASLVQSDIDISRAQGLTHLRNALLEDHNFLWPEPNARPEAAEDFGDGKWILEFRDPKGGKAVSLQFPQDCTHAAPVAEEKIGTEKLTTIPTTPVMAKGLREMFAEFSDAQSIAPPGPTAEGPPGPVQPAEPAR